MYPLKILALGKKFFQEFLPTYCVTLRESRSKIRFLGRKTISLTLEKALTIHCKTSLNFQKYSLKSLSFQQKYFLAGLEFVYFLNLVNMYYSTLLHSTRIIRFSREKRRLLFIYSLFFAINFLFVARS